VVAIVLALFGVRSLVVWGRRPLRSRTLSHHMLYAVWILCRAGLWFAVAGIFAISAAIDQQGRAFLDEWSRYNWYILVPLGLAAIGTLAGFALGRSPGELEEES
jgi:hypothetical protein